MHPEIARRIIQKYATDSTDIVLDPFMGSGGVLVESLLNGNNSLGIDLNPFAVFLSGVKTTPINTKNLEETYQEIIRKSKLDSQKNAKYDNSPENVRRTSELTELPAAIVEMEIATITLNKSKKLTKWKIYSGKLF